MRSITLNDFMDYHIIFSFFVYAAYVIDDEEKFTHVRVGDGV